MKSLFEYISEAVVDGQLPDQFSLSDDQSEDKVRWADGALDGVSIYHTAFSEMSDEDKNLMSKAIEAAAGNRFKKADRFFESLGQKVRAITIIDELQAYIIDHKDELPAETFALCQEILDSET